MDLSALELSLGDFYILEELFRNPNGAVYKARRKSNRTLCCLKERRFAELGRKRDILNEVRLMERLNHPFVIKCFGHFWDNATGSLYMVLEFAQGGDLYNFLLKRRTHKAYLQEEVIWKMFHQLCLGLHHLHENGIIHRDIKSLNIMLTKDGTVKIGDLGVSRQLGQNTLMLHTFYGTPLYASPELCDNRPYNEKTDLWSLGVVLYEMAALFPPFQSASLLGLADAIRRGTYSSLPSMYSPTLTRMVAMLLQQQFEKRPSIAEVLSWFPSPVNEEEEAKKKKEEEEEAAHEVASRVKLTSLQQKAELQHKAGGGKPISIDAGEHNRFSAAPGSKPATAAGPRDLNQRKDGSRPQRERRARPRAVAKLSSVARQQLQNELRRKQANMQRLVEAEAHCKWEINELASGDSQRSVSDANSVAGSDRSDNAAIQAQRIRRDISAVKARIAAIENLLDGNLQLLERGAVDPTDDIGVGSREEGERREHGARGGGERGAPGGQREDSDSPQAADPNAWAMQGGKMALRADGGKGGRGRAVAINDAPAANARDRRLRQRHEERRVRMNLHGRAAGVPSRRKHDPTAPAIGDAPKRPASAQAAVETGGGGGGGEEKRESPAKRRIREAEVRAAAKRKEQQRLRQAMAASSIKRDEGSAVDGGDKKRDGQVAAAMLDRPLADDWERSQERVRDQRRERDRREAEILREREVRQKREEELRREKKRERERERAHERQKLRQKEIRERERQAQIAVQRERKKKRDAEREREAKRRRDKAQHRQREKQGGDSFDPVKDSGKGPRNLSGDQDDAGLQRRPRSAIPGGHRAHTAVGGHRVRRVEVPEVGPASDDDFEQQEQRQQDKRRLWPKSLDVERAARRPQTAQMPGNNRRFNVIAGCWGAEK